MNPIPPGSTVGVLGSGQLGRMFAIAARQMGYRVHTFSPDSDTPTGQVADVEVTASYDDLDAVRAFARGVSVVTFEFENVPAPTAAAAAEFAPVRPGGAVLHTTQHRLREKTFLSKHGFPVAPFRHARTVEDLEAARQAFATHGKAVVKTAAFGYDGKGQFTVDLRTHVKWNWSPGTEYVVEAFIDFEREVSVVAARGVDGSFAHWGVIENTHVNHILDLSVAPASVPPDVAREA
ncbi:MAG: N5-carboxyaminoimidazole ribonucleotide synthase, partial [uncultured Phycisphaerae bacterium]